MKRKGEFSEYTGAYGHVMAARIEDQEAADEIFIHLRSSGWEEDEVIRHAGEAALTLETPTGWRKASCGSWVVIGAAGQLDAWAHDGFVSMFTEVGA